MASIRPDKSPRPSRDVSPSAGVKGLYNRREYQEWCRKFRALRSDKSLTIRPRTYRRLFKEKMGLTEEKLRKEALPSR